MHWDSPLVASLMRGALSGFSFLMHAIISSSIKSGTSVSFKKVISGHENIFREETSESWYSSEENSAGYTNYITMPF